MKALAVCVAWGLILSAVASDIRTVSQKKIDLQPVHDWKTAKANGKSAKAIGVRPLAHWKDLTVVEYVKALGDPVVTVKMEGGSTQTIMLHNCPAALLNKLNRRQAMTQQLKSAKLAASVAEVNAVEQEGKVSSGYTAVGSLAFVNAIAADNQRRQDFAATARAHAKRTEKTEATIKDELEKLNGELEAEGNLLAMATGQSYAGFPIWDTGIISKH